MNLIRLMNRWRSLWWAKSIAATRKPSPPNPSFNKVSEILRQILENKESMTLLKNILAAMKGPSPSSTSLFSGWRSPGSNVLSLASQEHGTDVGHSGNDSVNDTAKKDEENKDKENKPNITSTYAYKRMKTIKDMEISTQITELNSLLTSFEKQEATIGGAGKTDDDKNVLNMAILTFIREHAYDSILFKGLNEYDELYGTLNGLLKGTFDKIPEQQRVKAAQKALDKANADYEEEKKRHSADDKTGAQTDAQTDIEQSLNDASGAVFRLSNQKAALDISLNISTEAQRARREKDLSQNITDLKERRDVLDNKIAVDKQRLAPSSFGQHSISPTTTEKKLQEVLQKLEKTNEQLTANKSEVVTKEVSDNTKELEEVSKELEDAVALETKLKNELDASAIQDTRKDELAALDKKIKSAQGTALENAKKQSLTAADISAKAGDSGYMAPRPPKNLIQQLLNILLEKTSPIYTPQYFELKKLTRWHME